MTENERSTFLEMVNEAEADLNREEDPQRVLEHLIGRLRDELEGAAQ